MVENPKSRTYNFSKVKARDKVCQRCGRDHHLEVHHIQLYSKGGSNEMDNLITLCCDCHWFAPDDVEKFNEFISNPFPIRVYHIQEILNVFFGHIIMNLKDVDNIVPKFLNDKILLPFNKNAELTKAYITWKKNNL